MASEPQALSGRPWAGQRSRGSLESYRGDFDKYGRPTLKKIVCYKVIQSVSTLEWAISSAQPSKNTTVKERRGRDGEAKMVKQQNNGNVSTVYLQNVSQRILAHIWMLACIVWKLLAQQYAHIFLMIILYDLYLICSV